MVRVSRLSSCGSAFFKRSCSFKLPASAVFKGFKETDVRNDSQQCRFSIFEPASWNNGQVNKKNHLRNGARLNVSIVRSNLFPDYQHHLVQLYPCQSSALPFLLVEDLSRMTRKGLRHSESTGTTMVYSIH